MATNSALIAALTSAIQQADSLGYGSYSQSNDVFEGYIWAIVLVAARYERANIHYETSSGDPTRSLLFRTSPGNLFSTTRPYTHAVIRFPDVPELEAHIGVKVAGKSRLLHECDVAVLYRDEARNCGRNAVHPRSSAVVLTVECKFYSSTLPLDLGRSFLGLAGEISKEGRYLITNSTSRSIETLLTHHKLDREAGVVPDRKQADDLQKSFERLFRDYKLRW
jgi:hypothetical protein